MELKQDANCIECEKLRLALVEKDSEIEKLKIRIQTLSNYLSCKENRQEFPDSVCNGEGTSVEQLLLRDSDSLNKHCVLKSISVQTGTDICENSPVSDENTTRNTVEHQLEKYPDYVYDENYKMYYSLSTGYYYEEKSGLMYDPQSGAYYKYDYDKKEYEKIPQQEGINSNVHGDEKTSSDICESVVDQVSNLNLNDDSSRSEKVNVETESKNVLEYENDADEKENEVYDEASEAAPSENNNISLGCAKDWQPEEGSKLSVTDMVKQVVEEHTNMSDYIYDESCRMYYSPSTGYFYDDVRNLLYDPVSRTYYFYDATNQKYEFYYQAPSIIESNQTIASENDVNKNRLASRKKYWKKKLELSKQSPKSPKSPKSDEDNNNLLEMEEDFSAPEDGEIFSSDEDCDNPISIMKPPSNSPCSNQASSEDLFPPSIRAIVENSENLQIGSLILITCSGGIIGRDKANAIYLPDICVSKIHASVTFNNDFQTYSIEDLGSQNGTFINNKRLSEPKLKSEPQILSHGDKLSLGSCKLLLHIHEGHDTCDCCEPGQVLAEIAAHSEKAAVFISKDEKEKNRREELRRLKKKYGLQGADFEKKKTPAKTQGYEDKAEIRRQTVGSDNPYEKTVEASVDVSVPASNKGYQMLKKMGWKEGEKLGSSDAGLIEPIPLRPWTGTAGLGSSVQPSSGLQLEDKKSMKWVKARERYFQLSLKKDAS